MTTPTLEQSSDSLHQSLSCELDTAWAPDPWSWAEVELADHGPSVYAQLDVPLVGKPGISVPLLNDSAQVRLHKEALMTLSAVDPLLHPGSMAYRLTARGSIEHYRPAMRRLVARRRALETTPFALQTDIRSFFRSATASHFRSSPLFDEWSRLIDVVSELEGVYGYALPEGYAAARALGNLLLHPIDTAANSDALIRWVDDYTVFAETQGECEAALDRMSHAAAALGFELSGEKTSVRPSGEMPDQAMSVVHPTRGGTPSLQDAGRDYGAAEESLGFERMLRHQLRLETERGNTAFALALATRRDSTILESCIPRLAEAITKAPAEPALAACEALVAAASSRWLPWRLVRLAPALWRFGLPTSIRTELVDALATNPALGFTALGRVVARHDPSSLDIVLSRASARTRRLLQEEAKARQDRPPATQTPPPAQSFL